MPKDVHDMQNDMVDKAQALKELFMKKRWPLSNRKSSILGSELFIFCNEKTP